MKIPVILSIDKRPDGKATGTIYELETLLNPSLKGESPVTRIPFNLSDIMPAPRGLKKLEENIAAVPNQAGPSTTRELRA